LLIGKLEGTPPDGLKDFRHNLEFSAAWINCHLAPEDDFHAFFQFERNLAISALEHCYCDQRPLVL
jgi:hypothetical protein